LWADAIGIVANAIANESLAFFLRGSAVNKTAQCPNRGPICDAKRKPYRTCGTLLLADLALVASSTSVYRVTALYTIRRHMLDRVGVKRISLSKALHKATLKRNQPEQDKIV
jgi:hypothetical protein